MSEIDTVRLLIADTDPANQLLTDAQIQSFLALEGDNVKLAGAQALDTIASSEVLVSKVLKSQDVSTDGAKVADALRKHATELRRQADVDDEGDGYFEIVDFDPQACGPELSGW